MDPDVLKRRLAEAAVNRDVAELTKIALELEGSDDCALKLIRSAALRALGGLLAASDKELGLRYLRESVAEAKACNSKPDVASSYGYLLMFDPSAADEALSDLSPDDPVTGPVYAFALALKGSEEALRIVSRFFGSREAALYAFLMGALIPLERRDSDVLSDAIREAYRYQVYSGYEPRFSAMIEEALSRKLSGDAKAKAYSVAAALSGDKSLAYQAVKAAKDRLVKAFSAAILAEIIADEDPEMAAKYALSAEPPENARGFYVKALAAYVASRRDIKSLFDSMGYALRAFVAGLYHEGLSHKLVEPIVASVARTMAYLAYRTGYKEIAEALKYACGLIGAFEEYKRALAKACACAARVLGEDARRFEELSGGYRDDLLDECLS